MDKKFLFAQFRSIEETTVATHLDGITFGGKPLRIRRVKDYESLPRVEGERPIPKLHAKGTNKISSMVNDGPLKVMLVSKIRYTFPDWHSKQRKITLSLC
jgi:hypothetical protein